MDFFMHWNGLYLYLMKLTIISQSEIKSSSIVKINYIDYVKLASTL